MADYRAVILAPMVVEFESPGNEKQVTEQARRIAAGLGRAEAHASKDIDYYVPTLMEVVQLPNKKAPLVQGARQATDGKL